VDAGVGHVLIATTVSRLGNLSAALAIASGVMFAAIALQLLGVGHRLCFAIAPSVGLNAAPALSERLNIEPVSTVQGVGSNNPDPLPSMRRTNV
jgi:hypothetical protein